MCLKGGTDRTTDAFHLFTSLNVTMENSLVSMCAAYFK